MTAPGARRNTPSPTSTGWSSDDWYRDGEPQLHFYPRAKRLLCVAGTSVVAGAEAWGGRAPSRGEGDPTMAPQHSTPGTYVIGWRGPYVTRTWPWSRIGWGTPLRVSPDGRHLLYKTGAGPGASSWRRVDREIPAATLDAVKREYHALYGGGAIDGDGRLFDRDGDGVPEVWVFNDFGPWAVRYHADPNRNRRLDPGERLLGEMVHTTPADEANHARGLPVKLDTSHGCIHVKPADRDRLLALGAFEPGTLIAVHAPSEIVPERLRGEER